MKLSTAALPHPKRPVNLTLSGPTIDQARLYTNNLSATVDRLLADFVEREARARQDKLQQYAEISEAWNEFDERHGAFGHEHSPL